MAHQRKVYVDLYSAYNVRYL